MKFELMNDGAHKIELVYKNGCIAQMQVTKNENGFEEEIFFNISKNEARQIIEGFQQYIESSKDA